MNSTMHKINGKARTMLVTSSRGHVINHKQEEINRQIKANKYPIKTQYHSQKQKKLDIKEFTEI